MSAIINSLTQPLEDKKNLHVRQIFSSLKIKTVIHILQSWDKSAKQFIQKAQVKNPSEASRYESAHQAAKALIRDFSKRLDFKEKFYLACYDSDEQIQGIMVLTPAYKAGKPYQELPYLIIDLMLANPEHIYSSVLLPTARKISGIGEALIQRAEKICLQEQADGLILVPDPSSKGFYHHMGFEEMGIFMKKSLP